MMPSTSIASYLDLFLSLGLFCVQQTWALVVVACCLLLLLSYLPSAPARLVVPLPRLLEVRVRARVRARGLGG